MDRKLDEGAAQALSLEPIDMTESVFRWMMNEDAMATEKLAEGIRRFHDDHLKLVDSVQTALG